MIPIFTWKHRRLASSGNVCFIDFGKVLRKLLIFKSNNEKTYVDPRRTLHKTIYVRELDAHFAQIVFSF